MTESFPQTKEREQMRFWVIFKNSSRKWKETRRRGCFLDCKHNPRTPGEEGQQRRHCQQTYINLKAWDTPTCPKLTPQLFALFVYPSHAWKLISAFFVLRFVFPMDYKRPRTFPRPQSFHKPKNHNLSSFKENLLS